MDIHRFKADHRMSDQILRSIGDFVVSFAEMEYALKLGIQTLLTCDSVQKGIVTAGRNVSELIDLLRELYRTSENKRVPLETIENLCSEAEIVRTFRNKLFHATLTAINNETFELEKRAGRGKFVVKWQEVGLSEIDDFSEKAKYVAGDLVAICMGYHKITPPVV